MTLVRGTIVSTDEPAEDLPRTFELHQNYPNPFNPATTFARRRVSLHPALAFRLFEQQSPKPGQTPFGGFFQEVPLLGSTPTDIGSLTLTPEDGESVVLDFVDATSHPPTSTPPRPRSTPRSYSSGTASRTPATSGTTTRTST